MATRPPLVADHKRDLAWLIKLFLDIHGGDPAPFLRENAADRMAAEVIKAAAAHLDPAKRRAVTSALG